MKLTERWSGSHLAGPCEDWFEGCTVTYKKKFGAAWKLGAALGFVYPNLSHEIYPGFSLVERFMMVLLP